jgi:hypothetical protein
MELGRSERPTTVGVLSLRHFRLASWRSLSLGGGGRDSGAAHLDLLGPPGWCSGWWPHDGEVAAGGDFVLAILRFGADDGARAIGATDAAAAVEVRGRRRRPPGSNAALTLTRGIKQPPHFLDS